MTARTRRMPPKPSAAHLRMAAAMFAPPPRNPTPTLDLSWRGMLALLPDKVVSGELRNAHDWILHIQGNVVSARSLALRLFVARVGVLLVQADDLGITADLTEHSAGSWPLLMTLGDDGAWGGTTPGLPWRLAVAGTRTGAGRLGLVAVVEGLGA